MADRQGVDVEKRTCAAEDCDQPIDRHGARGRCSRCYKRWRAEQGGPVPRTEADRRVDSRYPPDDEIVAMMARLRSLTKVAVEIGVARESLGDFLRVRPKLRARMEAHRTPKFTLEEAAERQRRATREWARRWRAENPDEARKVRREHMRSYGPEYRRRWSHHKRLRRTGGALPDKLSHEYADVLRGDPCSYCGKPMQHVDHIQPIAHGGDGIWTNLTAACQLCNLQKRDRPLLIFLLDRLPV
jgi:5-methylcytosine-specific restriction endonuclease McrA